MVTVNHISEPQPDDWRWITIYRHTRALGVACSFVSMMFAGVIGINRNTDTPTVDDSPLTMMVFMNVPDVTSENLRLFNLKYQRYVIFWMVMGIFLGIMTDRFSQRNVTLLFYGCQITGFLCLFASNHVGGQEMRDLIIELKGKWFQWLYVEGRGFSPLLGLVLEDLGLSLLCTMNVWAGFCFDGYGQIFPKYTGMVMNIIAWGQVVGESFMISTLNTIQYITKHTTIPTCLLLLFFMAAVGYVHWSCTPVAYDPYVPVPWGPWQGVPIFRATRGFRDSCVNMLTRQATAAHGPLTGINSIESGPSPTTEYNRRRVSLNDTVQYKSANSDIITSKILKPKDSSSSDSSSSCSSSSSLPIAVGREIREERIKNNNCFKLKVKGKNGDMIMDLPEFKPKLMLKDAPPTYAVGIYNILNSRSFIWFFLMYECMSWFSAYMYEALPHLLLEKFDDAAVAEKYVDIFNVNAESRLSTIIPILLLGYAFDCYMSLGMAIVIIIFTSSPILLCIGYYLPKGFQDFNFIVYTIVLYNGSPLVQVFGSHLFGFYRLGFIQGFFGCLDGVSYTFATSTIAQTFISKQIESWAASHNLMLASLIVSIFVTAMASTCGYFLYQSVTRSGERSKPPIRRMVTIPYETV